MCLVSFVLDRKIRRLPLSCDPYGSIKNRVGHESVSVSSMFCLSIRSVQILVAWVIRVISSQVNYVRIVCSTCNVNGKLAAYVCVPIDFIPPCRFPSLLAPILVTHTIRHNRAREGMLLLMDCNIYICIYLPDTLDSPCWSPWFDLRAHWWCG